MEAEQKRIAERVELLMEQASRKLMEDFTEVYGRLETEMNRLTGKLDAVEQEKAERGYRERQCRLFFKAIQGLTDDGEADSNLFLALVDRVVVGKGMRFVLRDGAEWDT